MSQTELRQARFVSDQEQITMFLKDRDAELIVVVEGTDELSGVLLQARHSYRWEDILWNHNFVPCVLREKVVSFLKTKSSLVDDGICVIDFNKFHDVVPCSTDSRNDPIVDYIK